MRPTTSGETIVLVLLLAGIAWYVLSTESGQRSWRAPGGKCVNDNQPAVNDPEDFTTDYWTTWGGGTVV